MCIVEVYICVYVVCTWYLGVCACGMVHLCVCEWMYIAVCACACLLGGASCCGGCTQRARLRVCAWGLTRVGHAAVDGGKVLPLTLVHLLLHLVDARQVQGPQAALARRAARLVLHLLEALVQGQVVPHRVLPAVGSCLQVTLALGAPAEPPTPCPPHPRTWQRGRQVQCSEGERDRQALPQPASPSASARTAQGGSPHSLPTQGARPRPG